MCIGDYYHYFANKKNHPNKEDILKQEEQYTFASFTHENALQIGLRIVDKVAIYNKGIAIRIRYNDLVVFQYVMDEKGLDSLEWLSRKERVTNKIGHSSYYVFLDNIQSHKNDYMIENEKYGICGGCFPLIINNKIKGTISVTGLRPNEDHQIIIDTISEFPNL